MVISPEFNVDVALNIENRANVLQLFEGEGGVVKSNLYEKYKLDFCNTFFLLASNGLPRWSEFRA